MPKEFEIYEIKPGGRSMIDSLVKRMGDMSRRSDDVSEALGGIVEYMRKEFGYEFSGSNPAGWDALISKYRSWKAAHGYPVTIGILSGGLKEAMTGDAIVDIGPRKLTYEMNAGTIGFKGRSVGDYAKYFNASRPITKYVSGKVREKVRTAVKEAVKKGYEGKV
jgi:hypothetical protein